MTDARGTDAEAPGTAPLGTRKDAEILRITAPCNQRCVFCNEREDIGQPDGDELRARIDALAAEGLQRLVLSGGEPTLRRDLPALVAHARARGIPEVELQTNAVLCARDGYAATLAAAGLTSAFVPLHAPDAELSDALTGAPGTFAQTVAGARALLATDVIVTLNIVVNRRNYQVLPEWVRFVERELPGFRALSFSFVMSGGAAYRNRWIVPRMSDVAPYLRAAYAYCRMRGLAFSNPGCGVPVCFVPGYEGVSDEYRQLAGADLRALAELRNNQQEKAHVAACADCIHARYCLGIWKGYLDIHGEGEVVPVRAPVTPPDVEPAPPTTTGVGWSTGPRANEVLRLTLACNERCLFCNVPPEGDPSFAPPTTAEARAFIDRFAATAATGRELSFSGGEPTLRRDLEELVAYARERGIERVQIQTNARLLTPERAASLRAAGVTSAFVAYHSHLPAVQDALTGVTGSGPETLAGIRAASAAGIPVSVNPVLTRLNLASFPDFIDHLAAEAGPLEVVCITLVQPHGRAAEHPELLPRYADALPVLEEALRRARGHGLRTDTHYASLPLCFLPPELLEASHELNENKALRERPPGQPLEERVTRVFSGKVQGPPCATCTLKNFCNGVWRAYARRHGFEDIRAPRRSLAVWGTSPSEADGPPPAGAGDAVGRALVLEMGRGCNSGCRVCAVRGRSFPDDLATLERQLAAGRQAGAEQVTFTGQEPTLHGDLPRLVATARRAGYRVIQLATNGRRLAYARYARDLVDAGLTEALVPLWSADAAVHDAVTRVDGSFLQTLKGVRRLREAAAEAGGPFRGVTITLGAVVTRWCVDGLAELVALAARAGVPRLALVRQIPTADEPPPSDARVLAGLRAAAARAEGEAVTLSLVGFPSLGEPTLDALREEALPGPVLAPLWPAELPDERRP